MTTAVLFLGERTAPAPEASDAPPAERRDLSEAPARGASQPAARSAAATLSPALSLTALAVGLECGELTVLDEVSLAPELRTRVALTTLRRRADKRGKAPLLRCVTREVRALARAAGWRTEQVAAPALALAPGPVGAAEAARGAATPPWRRIVPRGLAAWPRPAAVPPVAARPELPALPAVRALPAACGVLAVGVALAALLYPNASVTLEPSSEAWRVEMPVVVDPNVKKADPATGKLPGHTITREVSETATAPATGKKTVPDGKASGEVVLLNRSDRAVTVPKGTTVLAGSVKFATLADATVAPSRRAGAAQIFGMATARVQAITGGPSGNVDRNKIDQVEGPLSASLSVQNTAPLRGGTERQATFVTDADRRTLQDSLYRTLSDRVAQQLKKDLPPSDKETVVPWSGQGPAVVEASFSKGVDEEAQTVSLTLRVRYGATAFANDGYNRLAMDLAQIDLARRRPGYALAGGTLQAEAPSVAGIEDGVLRLVARAHATVTPRLDERRLRSELAGKTVPAARDYLAELPGTAGYSLAVNNFLPGRMPALGWRIGVRAQARVA